MSDKFFWKHQKSIEFVSIKSSVQFMMHSYTLFVEIPRYLEITLTDVCETSHSRRQAPKA